MFIYWFWACIVSTKSNGICTPIHSGGLPKFSCFSFIKGPSAQTALTEQSVLIVAQISLSYDWLPFQQFITWEGARNAKKPKNNTVV